MKRFLLLPSLAVKRVIQNGNVYFPYILSCIVSVFTYYIFSSILLNDLMATLPHSAYAWIMLMIGKVLLVIILIPFIYYANSFLVKRRKKEIGLYTLLGMERKHLLMLLFLETLFVYAVIVCVGILFGSVLAKLFFLLLLKLSRLPIEVTFTFTWRACIETLIFFAVVSFFTFLHGAVGIFHSRPAELRSGNKKGEKEPRFPLFGAILGVAITLYGYWVVFHSELDSTIFTNFFQSVFCVVVGSYLLFTFASVAVLRQLRRQKALYYRPENFVTLSGMYYRMKKSAASLANISIFSTMVVITLTCTVSLYAGIPGIMRFEHPYDAIVSYQKGDSSRDEIEEKLLELSDRYGQEIQRLDSYQSVWIECGRIGDIWGASTEEGERCNMNIITLSDYQALTGEAARLADGEVLLYSTGTPYPYDTINFMDVTREVSITSTPLHPWPVAGKSYIHETYVLVVKDEREMLNICKAWTDTLVGLELDDITGLKRESSGILLSGDDANKQEFMEALLTWQRENQDHIFHVQDGVEGRQILYSMNGGLLFIGILFGLIFFVCLLLIMYYKQLSEGYEDEGSFAIMQKVGLGEEDIKSTIRKQILAVFTLPLLLALLHFAVGMQMVEKLMGVIQMFDTTLLINCSIGVAIVFAILYTISYLVTSRAYYRIVKG